jgi:hypothetical protein
VRSHSLVQIDPRRSGRCLANVSGPRFGSRLAEQTALSLLCFITA